ncbi:DUF5753 domain-containing protein [Streptomyces nanshensis]|uniref:DUF5753 domain-containing protein n=1 Tax=Streptomyces nanshensis TaxID=518642 RepID=A0A1E7KZ40_9ACTN|nr:DUF5753 domain-containing protein [Streptomyces nanshensis]OEV09218.1 hypothetical protein AN218_22345 [Streptomyces nanshensis]
MVWGTYLRGLRNQQHLNLADVVQAGAARSIATLSRVETATTPLTESVLVELLTFYGANDPPLSLGLGRVPVGRVWRSAFTDVYPRWAERRTCLDRAVTEIRSYSTLSVPEWLQTPAYASALACRGHTVPTTADLGRTERPLPLRRYLLERHPPRDGFAALVDETVLARPIGGRAVLHQQLEDLCSRVEDDRPRIRVRIFPLAAWENAPAPGPAASHLTFPPGGSMPALLHQEAQHNGGTYLTAPCTVASHRASFTGMWEQAGSRQQSLDILHRHLRAL